MNTSTEVTSCSLFSFPLTPPLSALPPFPKGASFFKDLATNQSSAKIKSTDGISDLQGPLQSCTVLHFISHLQLLCQQSVLSFHIHPPGLSFKIDVCALFDLS